MSWYRAYGKRLLDIFVSVILILFLFPIIIITTGVLFFVNKGTPFFFQERPGQFEKVIKIVKFKSMRDPEPASGRVLSDNERITRFGRFIRQTSIDELPQLFNVLNGDMSLIGPRPLLFKYLPLYSAEQRNRHLVKPGITGWAQVNGRNSISWTTKFQYDIEYVNSFSFSLDLKIVWLTLRKVIVREGIDQSKERPMEPFNGSN